MDAMISFFQTGGLFMYPILIVFAFGVAIAIERYLRLTTVRNANREMWDKLQPVLSEGDFETARTMTADNKSTISHLLNSGLELQGAVRRRDDIEIAMEETMMEIIPQLEKRTPYVALFSNIATLLGLLGTIMGLIQAFTAVANANPAGIPLLIVYVVLTSKTGEIVDSLEMASVKTLSSITKKGKRQVDAAAA